MTASRSRAAGDAIMTEMERIEADMAALSQRELLEWRRSLEHAVECGLGVTAWTRVVLDAVLHEIEWRGRREREAAVTQIEADGHIRECGNGGSDPDDCSPPASAPTAPPASSTPPPAVTPTTSPTCATSAAR